ncbi:MAG: NADH-quinone oxidoreductase subunit NuoE [Bacteroidales bacterium]|nr:NADH-quinone oxidoreductase subunit NuoE [Bacteroidales bacterium]
MFVQIKETAMKEKILEILEKYPEGKPEYLIAILQDIQEAMGYLSREAMEAVSRHTSLTPAKVFGVATFYNQFRFKPLGKYHIQVCRGTACHVLGSATVLEHLEKLIGIKAGDTTRDGLFSLEVVACLGACGLAPVVTVNNVFYASVDQQKIEEIIKTCRHEQNALVEQ